jgi:very-short-patch-repair endonuclease
MLKKPAATVKRAKRLRREMSLPEVLLWQELRKRPFELKFRHQHPAGLFSLDFYCARARLCIEVDGDAHDRIDQAISDEERDALLAHHGVKTIRIQAVDILRELDAVMIFVLHEARTRLPLHHPASPGGPPPQA